MVSALCSDCFVNEGLRAEAIKIGVAPIGPCPNCASQSGFALAEDEIVKLFERFFVSGSQWLAQPSVYIPDYTNVSERYGFDSVKFDETLNPDYETLATRVGRLRYRAPNLRRLGFPWLFDDFVTGLQNMDRGDYTKGAEQVEKVPRRFSNEPNL
jgi:hypothetical protein